MCLYSLCVCVRRQTERQTDRQNDRQTDTDTDTDRQRDRQTDRQADRQTDRHRQTDKRTRKRADKQTYIHTYRRTDKQTDRKRHRIPVHLPWYYSSCCWVLRDLKTLSKRTRPSRHNQRGSFTPWVYTLFSCRIRFQHESERSLKSRKDPASFLSLSRFLGLENEEIFSVTRKVQRYNFL